MIIFYIYSKNKFKRLLIKIQVKQVHWNIFSSERVLFKFVIIILLYQAFSGRGLNFKEKSSQAAVVILCTR